MIKFQGRSMLKQYLPQKPVKRGIKVWVLADAMNGYFCRFEVYCGKKGSNVEKGLATRVVKDLTNDFQGKHHHIFFDNFFTSLELIQDLKEVGIYACGTARKNRRGFPDQLQNPKLNDRYVIQYIAKQALAKNTIICAHTYVHSPTQNKHCITHTHTHSLIHLYSAEENHWQCKWETLAPHHGWIVRRW